MDGQEVRDQVAAIRTACGRRGLALGEVITDLVEGEDTPPERPGLQYALRRLAAGEASCLVVAELGRLSRSAPEVDHIVEWLRRRDARLVLVGDGLDTGTRTGGKADMPVSLPGQRPTGNANTSRGLARHDVPALKKRIRAMRASGMTLQAIANSLNGEHVPTLRGGRMWRPSGVQAAAGYSRPGRGASESRNGGERDADGSIEETRERSWRSASGQRPRSCPMSGRPIAVAGARRETWLPATPAGARAARFIVREAAAEAGLEGESAWDLMLAATEAVANAVQHGKAWPNDCILFVTEPCRRWSVGGGLRPRDVRQRAGACSSRGDLWPRHADHRGAGRPPRGEKPRRAHPRAVREATGRGLPGSRTRARAGGACARREGPAVRRPAPETLLSGLAVRYYNRWPARPYGL